MRTCPKRHYRCLMIGLLFIVTAIGCASRPYLMVDYRIPPDTYELKGLKARIQIKDLRKDHEIMTPSAAEHFEGFKDRYNLTWVTENKERISAGEKDLQGLFYETFKKRLERLDVQIVAETDDTAPLFQILINTFKIDLQDHKWMAQVSYEANLSIDNQLVARELISGSAERVKIVGSKGADTTLSEIFSDIINKLDIIKLYRQAKLV